MGELESGINKATGNNLATLEHQFRFSAQKERADLDHPRCGGQTDACAPCLTEDMQEVTVWKRMWRGTIAPPAAAFTIRTGTVQTTLMSPINSSTFRARRNVSFETLRPQRGYRRGTITKVVLARENPID